VDTLPEVPEVAAEPYRLLLAGDWRAAAAALRLLDDLGAGQRLRRQPG
jgi:hypothetical protein